MRAPFLLVAHDLVAAVPGTRVALGPDDVHHLGRVLRRADGDELELCDGAGHVVPAVLEGDGARTTAPARRHEPVLPRVDVVHALPKGRALDDVVRVLTELGATSVQPVLTARTVARPSGPRAVRAVQRWQSVADAAAAQARRPHRLDVGPVRELAEVGAAAAGGGVLLLAEPSAEQGLGAALRRSVDQQGTTQREPAAVTVAVGPEGGFTSEEVTQLAEHGWRPVNVGRTVLRTVHAAAVLVAAVHALRGRFDGQ